MKSADALLEDLKSNGFLEQQNGKSKIVNMFQINMHIKYFLILSDNSTINEFEADPVLSESNMGNKTECNKTDLNDVPEQSDEDICIVGEYKLKTKSNFSRLNKRMPRTRNAKKRVCYKL